MSDKSRFTIRLTDDNLELLRNKACKTESSVNSLINQLIYRVITLDTLMHDLPVITLPQDMLIQMLPALSKQDIEKLARQDVKTIKRKFSFSGYEYNFENIANNYFTMLERNWKWFRFNYHARHNHLKIVFETDLGQSWIDFLLVYLREFLVSLSVTITKEEIIESVIVFEVSSR